MMPKITVISLLVLVVLFQQTCNEVKEMGPTYGHCIDVWDNQAYGVGVIRDAEQKKHWVAFEGAKVVNSVEDTNTLGTEATQTHCRMDNESMHYLWASHSTEPQGRPRKSDKLYYGVYNFKSKKWSTPQVIWRVEERVTFDWSYDKTSFFHDDKQGAHVAFLLSDYRYAVISQSTDQHTWQSKFVEVITVPRVEGGTEEFRMDGYPGLFIDDLGRYYISFMARYFKSVQSGVAVENDLYVIYSDDNGNSWSTAILVSETKSTNRYMPYIWEAEGHIHLSWRESIFEKEFRRLSYVSSEDKGRTWSEPQYIPLSSPKSFWKEMCSDDNGNTHLTLGSISGRPLEYFILQNRKWRKIADVSSYYPESKYMRMVEPVLSCSGNQIFLYMTGYSPPDSLGISHGEMVFARLDTLQAKK